VSGIDFSDEGLADRVVGVEAEPVADVVEDAPEVVEEAVEETPDVASEVPETPVEDTPAEPEVDAPEPSEWQVRYDEAQKVIGRQGQELGELRRMVETIQQQAQPEPQQPTIAGWQPTTADELLDGAASESHAEAAYVFAAEHAPDYVADVIAEVQSYDPALAKRMEFDYYQRMLEARTAPLQQTVVQSQAQTQLVNAVQSFKAEVPEWDAIQDEVAKVLEAEPWLIGEGAGVDEVIRGLRAAVKMVGQARDSAQQYAQQQAQVQRVQQRQQAVVETGTPAAAPPVEDVSEADAIRNAIFEEDRRRREALS
jgi:hypothetical protein